MNELISRIVPGSAIHQEMRVWVRIPAVFKNKTKKIKGRHLGVMTWVWPGPLRVSKVQGRNTCYKGIFFSEDSLLSSSPMSFYLPMLKNYSDTQISKVFFFLPSWNIHSGLFFFFFFFFFLFFLFLSSTTVDSTRANYLGSLVILLGFLIMFYSTMGLFGLLRGSRISLLLVNWFHGCYFTVAVAFVTLSDSIHLSGTAQLSPLPPATHKHSQSLLSCRVLVCQ